MFDDNPHFVRPEARRNEVLGRLKEGLLDVPISRSNFSWGIAVPDAPNHVIYVWIDALFNYVTAMGLGEPDGEWAERACQVLASVSASPWKGNSLVPCCDLASALDGTGYASAALCVLALLLDQRGQEDVQIAGELHRS